MSTIEDKIAEITKDKEECCVTVCGVVIPSNTEFIISGDNNGEYDDCWLVGIGNNSDVVSLGDVELSAGGPTITIALERLHEKVKTLKEKYNIQKECK